MKSWSLAPSCPRPGILAYFVAVSLTACLVSEGEPRPQSVEPIDPESSHYSYREPTRGGTGKVYMGREIAQFLSHHGIPWLEREDRLETERPDEVVDRLKLSPTDVVADIGAGSGYFTFRLAKAVPQGKVLAVDIQSAMLDFLEARRAELGITNVQTVLGGLEDPGLAPSSVDLALLVDVYHELSHPKEMMLRIARSLKPGGRLVLVEYRGENRFSSIHPLHKMTRKQIKRELATVGLVHRETLGFLPRQHVMIFGNEP